MSYAIICKTEGMKNGVCRMNTKKVWIQTVINLIALIVSPFYLAIAAAYVGYMIYLVAAKVQMGIILLVPMFIFLPVILAGCLLPIIRIISTVTCIKALKCIKKEEYNVTRKFSLAAVLSVLDGIATVQILLFDAIAALAAFGSAAGKLLAPGMDEGIAGFILFFVIIFSLIPVFVRIGLETAYSFINKNDSKKTLSGMQN